MKSEEYKIEIIMTPHTDQNKERPYFWCIFEYFGSGYCNTGYCGWEETPEKAWQKANKDYELLMEELKCK